MVKFKSDRVVVTTAVNEQVPSLLITELLNRHFNGDWGDTSKDSVEMNNEALKNEDDKSKRETIFSLYKLEGLRDMFVITEHDRSVTTVLFSDEY